ncbi:NmrA family transcriptional regulator [Natronosporangium hydrolyticum]|uniref:NmrA family transcriptional regulator n=1 Tax=Natronosporangium hydrolyticum TaxID=2811111 RepID=A0A895YS04_9ACTN|nr:NmrA family transcriptional regulator [Natronosporangium hydrolyticum]QSB16798.1 NmrA family transcriptional regulator [Natronosporangium hydrolyticum]
MTGTHGSTQTKPILVTASSGKTGSRVAQRLVDKGMPVRLGSRNASPRFDWEDQNTWRPALADVSAAYICFVPDLGFPGAADAVGAFSKIAVDSGVERLVLLSGRGEPEARAGEEAVQASGGQVTVVRASWFNQNFSENFLLESVLGSEIALPAGNAAEPFVDADDIADVAVAALTEDGHGGQEYEVTGPRLLTFHDVASELTAVTGREIRYTPLTTDQYADILRANDLPLDFLELFTKILDGRNAQLTDGVQRALGRPPRDFRDYAQATAATGVWG